MIPDKIRAAIVSSLGVRDNDITLDARIVEDLGADSLDVAHLMVTLEQEYGVTAYPEDDARILSGTVADLVALFEPKAAA